MPQKKRPRKKNIRKKGRRILPSYVFFSVFIMVFVFLTVLAVLGKPFTESLTSNQEKQQFIVKISGYAQVLQEEYGVLPSISIAQAILESNWGKSELAQKNNNFYGIKGSNPENTVEMATKEFVDGEWIDVQAPFRTYSDWRGSMEDHARLMVDGTQWDSNLYAGVLAAENYKEAAYALQQSGYATDPTYPEKLIQLIEQYQLNQYDE